MRDDVWHRAAGRQGWIDRHGLTCRRRAARQAGVDLGVWVKAEWEWAAVLGQVEVHGWTKLDVRCYAPRE